MKYKYEAIDRFVYLNQGDPNLFPIEIDQLDLIQRTYRHFSLEEPQDFPDFEFVEGHGLPPEQQKFQREVIPQGLIELERSIRTELKPKGKARELSPVRRELKVIELFWEQLEENQQKYETEIAWLKTMWYYRLFGKHFFCNGKHTYIPGHYWFFLNFWYLNNNILPEYRDRDRRWSIGLKYCELTTTTFKDIDEKTGLPVKNEYGVYEMVDTGKRTIFGANFPKSRRVGDTSRIECVFTELVTRTSACKIGIQGMSDENATTVFQEHFAHPFIRLPLFWKPVWDAAGGIAPKNSMMFDDFDDVEFGLHSMVDFATSSDKAKYDGKFLSAYHCDEGGKMQRNDINDVVGVVKFCLSLGAGSKIHGIGAITTTCDEISEASAGENYMKFCNRSHFEKRDANGQTESGFVDIYFRAEDGLQDYIGPYGESVIEKPTPEQAMYIGKDYGARQFIENKIAAFRRAKDWYGLALFRRQHPQCYIDIFTPPPANQVLRRDLIEEQIQFLQTNKQYQAIRGDFYWKNGFGSEVGWMENPTDGRFYLSRKFKQNETNKRVFRDGMWYPADMTTFVGSPDTFGINTPSGRASKGGLIITWLRDVINDPLEKEQDQVESDRDILTYSFRPDTLEGYQNDMLMAHVYCGAMCFPESNKPNIAEYFRRMGYGGYLLSNHDRVTGKAKPEPGWYNQSGIVEAAIRWLQDDVAVNVKRCYHLNLLQEYLEFGGRSYITDLDLIASKLGTLIAKKNPFYNFVKGANATIDVTGWIPGYEG